jgi:hypothetical protein
VHGYYSALLVREGDAVKIFEETVNVAARRNTRRTRSPHSRA